MPHNQQEHYIVMKATGQGTWTNRIEVMVKQFRYLEDLLLLWSIPALIGSLLLWAMSSVIGESVPFLAFIFRLLVTSITIVIACILFLKWIETLQQQGRILAQTMSEENIRRFTGVSTLCLLQLILILATAASGGDGPLIVLQMLVFILLGWHYRSLLKRFSRV